jgi:hypothetical protein
VSGAPERWPVHPGQGTEHSVGQLIRLAKQQQTADRETTRPAIPAGCLDLMDASGYDTTERRQDES